jgi:hypothetical protein
VRDLDHWTALRDRHDLVDDAEDGIVALQDADLGDLQVRRDADQRRAGP